MARSMSRAGSPAVAKLAKRSRISAEFSQAASAGGLHCGAMFSESSSFMLIVSIDAACGDVATMPTRDAVSERCFGPSYAEYSRCVTGSSGRTR